MLVRILPLPGLGLGRQDLVLVLEVVEVGSVQETCSRRFRALRVRSRIRNTKDQDQDPDQDQDLVRTLIIIRRDTMRTSRLLLLRGGIAGLEERWAGDKGKARDRDKDQDRDKDMVAGRTGMEKDMVEVVIITTITIVINSSITIG